MPSRGGFERDEEGKNAEDGDGGDRRNSECEATNLGTAAAMRSTSSAGRELGGHFEPLSARWKKVYDFVHKTSKDNKTSSNHSSVIPDPIPCRESSLPVKRNKVRQR